jgi:PEP-CTERM motif
MEAVNARCFGLVLGGMLLLGPGAHATTVTYLTTGTFTSSGTSAYTQGPVTIAYTSSGPNTLTVPPGSQVSFGTFTVSTASATLTTVSDTFTLRIIEISPTSSTLTFVGKLSGKVSQSESFAFVGFAAPLKQDLGHIAYTIESSDDGTRGRVNLLPPAYGGGATAIAGLVAHAPEPSTMVMLGLGAPALLVVMYRNRGSRRGTC